MENQGPMPHFFACFAPARRRIFRKCATLAARPAAALLVAAAFAAPVPAGAQENPLRSVTNAIGLTTPTSAERPDFVRASRPDEEKMDFIPFVGPEKKRIPLKTPEQAAADDAALVADKSRAQARLKKLQAQPVEKLAPAPKPPAVTDQF